MTDGSGNFAAEPVGILVSLNTSPGGVPKRPVDQAWLTRLGLTGDRQAHPKFHGGPDRALCLYSLERIQVLQREGHPIHAGSTGENATVAGLDWDRVGPGSRLAIGPEAEVEITSYTVPCKQIAGSFLDGRFVRISQKLHPGMSRLYARVLREGTLAVGQTVRLIE